MREITFREALNEAFLEEMKRDKRVFIIGEEVGQAGGTYKIFKGAMDAFGEDRARDTPISEAAFMGVGIGAALAGMKPIVDFMYADFMSNAFTQIVNNLAKIAYTSRGRVKAPVVVRAMIGRGRGYGYDHSQASYTWFLNVPGLKIVLPSTPYDAKGLMKAAIRDESPVLFFEPHFLYGMKGHVPEEEYIVPLGKADIKKEGSDITMVAISGMVPAALNAAEKLQKEGISVEVIDPRTLIPLDKEAIFNSVKKTGRMVTIEFSHKTNGVGAEISAMVTEEIFDYLDAPILRVAAPDVPEPGNWRLADLTIPKETDIVDAVRKMLAKV